MAFIIGGLDDQLILLVWANVSKLFFAFNNKAFYDFFLYKEVFWPLLKPFETNEPILWLVMSLCLSIFGINFYNFFLLFTLAAAFTASFYLFKEYKFGLLYSVVFTFSSYTWSHLGIHLGLSQIWLLPVFYKIFLDALKLKSFQIKKFFISGVILALIALTANYLAFFILLSLFAGVVLIVILPSKIKLFPVSLLVKGTMVTFVVFVSISIATLYPFIKANYFDPALNGPKAQMMVIDRPLSDFFTFSTRPWYFFIPPPSNPILGGLGQRMISTIKSTNYFLADDYFEGEHAASFYGYSLYILFGTLFITLVKKKKVPKESIFWLLQALVLFLIALPPFISLNGIKIYTPGFLLFKFFPMFRVSTRLGIFILFFCILALAELIKVYYPLVVRKRLFVFCVFTAFIVSIIEVFVPVKIFKYEDPPDVYVYLKAKTDGSTFVVFPYSKTKEALFWLPVHQKFLLNPRGAFFKNFYSETFTKALNTNEGIFKLKDYNVRYLIVFKNSKEADLKEILTHPLLQLEAEFEDSYLLLVGEDTIYSHAEVRSY
ncbi:MAG: hypothetical protein AAB443_00925 [Patescibacteria group bacterium]